MKESILIFNKEMEFDFLSGWIKFNRLSQEISLEALSHGICSLSHLSQFENGKKRLRAEIIEALLKKLNIDSTSDFSQMGMIREKFLNLTMNIEYSDFPTASLIYNEISAFEDLLLSSPYSIEYTVYKLMYRVMVQRCNFNELRDEIKTLDKIMNVFPQELLYIYLLSTGKVIYDFKDHDMGISRFLSAKEIHDSPWINYRLGVSYCNDQQHLKATYCLHSALDSYEKSGRFYNALWCHNFLGNCYTNLKLYDRAQSHYVSVLNGSDYLQSGKNIFGIYHSMATLSLHRGEHDSGIEWGVRALRCSLEDFKSKWNDAAWRINDNLISAVCILIECYSAEGKTSECESLFQDYLKDEHKHSRFYNYLRFLYLKKDDLFSDYFYRETIDTILPFYENIGYMNMVRKIKLILIQYHQEKRCYKEALNIAKELIIY